MIRGFLNRATGGAWPGSGHDGTIRGPAGNVLDDGSPAGFLRGAFLRFLLPVAIIIGLNMFTLVLGYVFLLVDFCFIFGEDGRCLHDLMAGTKVVSSRTR